MKINFSYISLSINDQTQNYLKCSFILLFPYFGLGNKIAPTKLVEFEKAGLNSTYKIDTNGTAPLLSQASVIYIYF